MNISCSRWKRINGSCFDGILKCKRQRRAILLACDGSRKAGDHFSISWAEVRLPSRLRFTEGPTTMGRLNTHIDSDCGPFFSQMVTKTKKRNRERDSCLSSALGHSGSCHLPIVKGDPEIFHGGGEPGLPSQTRGWCCKKSENVHLCLFISCRPFPGQALIPWGGGACLLLGPW